VTFSALLFAPNGGMIGRPLELFGRAVVARNVARRVLK